MGRITVRSTRSRLFLKADIDLERSAVSGHSAAHLNFLRLTGRYVARSSRWAQDGVGRQPARSGRSRRLRIAVIRASWVYAINLTRRLTLFTIFYPLLINTHSSQSRLRQGFQRSDRRQSQEKIPMLRSQTVAIEQNSSSWLRS